MQRPQVPTARWLPDSMPLPEMRGIETHSWPRGTSAPRRRSSQLVGVELLCVRRRLLIPPWLVIASSLATCNGPQAAGGPDVHRALSPSDKETTPHG